jgi:hypothetical protein
MRDFDAFTVNIAGGDPVKRAHLERGTVVEYWDAAEVYAKGVVAAWERDQKATKKHSISSRRG